MSDPSLGDPGRFKDLPAAGTQAASSPSLDSGQTVPNDHRAFLQFWLQDSQPSALSSFYEWTKVDACLESCVIHLEHLSLENLKI